ncbi:hypothetical protein R7Z80_17710 [Vibrio sp. 1733]|nr:MULTISPECIES: hypothetical protein [Vibrio]MDA0406368.1 hypothetical protein [Vibrio alginolyticus]MDW2187694.1 hypothetical protein [Vibrio sp. 1733]MDW2238614.1 hypothetical protein [Vibrio sp. 1565-1]UYI47948.1 hypothetical protein OFO16_04525 [Vibrio natriegens]
MMMKVKTLLGAVIIASSVNVYADDILDIDWTEVTRAVLIKSY